MVALAKYEEAPVAMSVCAGMTALVQAQPDAIALIAGARRVTYAALDAQAARIACALVARGVRAGDRVGVALDRSVELVATMLGVLRLGAAVVPLDPAWPAARRGRIVADASLAHVIDAIEERDGADPAIDVPADAIALALYTSGSTGEPKAALLDHRALAARLHGLALAMPYRAGDVACHRTPATFVDAYAEIFGPLLAGVPAVVLPHPLAIADLAAAIETAGVTRLLLVPSLLALLLDARPALPPSLRIVATSGEALPEALAKRFFAASRAQLVNIYGSTEVAGDATCGVVAPGEPITIGRPLAGVELRLVDGELHVGGPVVARGYWKRPELTAARFVTEAGTTWFKTGDRARRIADGRYVLAGRIDDQVKIAGVRVELGDVEAALRAFPGVTAAMAAAREGRLIAGVVGDVDDTDLPALRAHLRTELPSAAVPHSIAILEALPTNAHGKLDRRALGTVPTNTTYDLQHREIVEAKRADPTNADDERADFLARPALAATITVLVDWFSELAGTAAGPDDELAAIGGDSLARLGLLVKLEQAGWHLEHGDLPHPLTPSRLAALLAQRPAKPHIAPPIASDATPFPVTDFQRVMVLDSLANGDAPVWLDQIAYTLHGRIDAARFEAAWRAEIAAQPALRTQFVIGTDIAQRVLPEIPFALARLDHTALDLAAYRQRVKAEEWTRISRAFALDAAPLFEVCLLQGPGRCDLVFTYHHALLDGESARRVLRDVLARYDGRRVTVAGESFRAACERPAANAALVAHLAGHIPSPPAPAPKQTGMGDLAWRLFHRLLAIRAWLAAWRLRRRARKLGGLLGTYAPAVYAGGDIASQPLPRVLDAAVTGWARAHGATPIAVWSTAFALHLARERCTHDVLFGVVVSGRDGRSADTVGMLANCLPLRVQLDPAASIADTVATVTQHLAALDAAGRTPLLALAAAAGLDPRAFLDTLVTAWRFPTDPAWSPSVRVDSGRGLTMTAPHTAMIVTPSELAVGAKAFHRTDRIRRELLALVDAMLAAPGAPVAQLLELAVHEGGLAVAQPAL